METVMRRAAATNISAGKILFLLLWYYGCFALEKVHPLQGGYLRRKYRTDRRPGFPIENPLLFYPKYAAEFIYKHAMLAKATVRYGLFRRRLKSDPKAAQYMDRALTPVMEDDLDTFEIFTSTESAKSAVTKVRVRKQELLQIQKR